MRMAEIRYHLDEHIHAAVAVGLRRRGIDVTTTVEAGLMHASDPEQLAFALAQQRVLVTRDRHFLVLASQGSAHAGIAFARKGRGAIGHMVLSLAHLHRTQSAENMTGRVEYL